MSVAEFGAFADQNRPHRRRMEDAHCCVPNLGGNENAYFFGVFDGHAGKDAAVFASTNMPNILADAIAQSGTDNMQEVWPAVFAKTDEQLAESPVPKHFGVHSLHTHAQCLTAHCARCTRVLRLQAALWSRCSLSDRKRSDSFTLQTQATHVPFSGTPHVARVRVCAACWLTVQLERQGHSLDARSQSERSRGTATHHRRRRIREQQSRPRSS